MSGIFPVPGLDLLERVANVLMFKRPTTLAAQSGAQLLEAVCQPLAGGLCQQMGWRQFLAELDALARLTPSESRQLSLRVVCRLASWLPGDEVKLIDNYIAHLPGLIHRRLPLIGTEQTSNAITPALVKGFLLPRFPGLPPVTRLPGSDLQIGYWLGGGGAGDVYEAHYLVAAAEPLIVKVAKGPNGAQLVRIEATLLQQLKSRRIIEGIPTYHGQSTSNLSTSFLVLHHLHGYSLDEVLHFWPGAEQFFTPDCVIQRLTALAHILAPVHARGLVHRDLKPSNILLARRTGNCVKPYVIDWGVAGLAASWAPREWELGRDTAAAHAWLMQYARTVGYASPQQEHGELCTPADDVYTLGVLAIELLIRDARAPRYNPDWQQQARARGTPEWFVKLLACCIHERRQRRPADAGDLSRCLDQRTLPE